MGLTSSVSQASMRSDECPRYARKRTLTVTVCGDPGVGKTSLQFMLAHEKAPKPKQLRTNDAKAFYKTITLSNGRALELEMLDICGKNIPRASTPSWNMAEINFVVYDVSVDSEIAEESIRRWIAHARSSICITNKVVLIGNKMDIWKSPETRAKAIEIAAEFEIPYFEVSTDRLTGWMPHLLGCIDQLAIDERLGIPPDYYIGGPGFDLDENDHVGNPPITAPATPSTSQNAAPRLYIKETTP